MALHHLTSVFFSSYERRLARPSFPRHRSGRSLAAFAGIFAEGPPGALTEALVTSAYQLPLALVGGMMAGAVTGGLLELFEFAWVDRA